MEKSERGKCLSEEESATHLNRERERQSAWQDEQKVSMVVEETGSQFLFGFFPKEHVVCLH